MIIMSNYLEKKGALYLVSTVSPEACTTKILIRLLTPAEQLTCFELNTVFEGLKPWLINWANKQNEMYEIWKSFRFWQDSVYNDSQTFLHLSDHYLFHSFWNTERKCSFSIDCYLTQILCLQANKEKIRFYSNILCWI